MLHSASIHAVSTLEPQSEDDDDDDERRWVREAGSEAADVRTLD